MRGFTRIIELMQMASADLCSKVVARIGVWWQNFSRLLRLSGEAGDCGLGKTLQSTATTTKMTRFYY